MGIRRVFVLVVCTFVVVVGQAGVASSATIGFVTQCSAADFNGDWRLGPAELPTWGSVGLEVRTYDRLGGLTPDQFLATYWDPTAQGGQGGWRYPPNDGFLIGPNGQPVHAPMEMRMGQKVDRYGSERGAFLAPIASGYAQRALPPSSLDDTMDPGGCNYHAYKVLRDFTVDGGPIAPGFAQPGNGVQYELLSALIPGAPAKVSVGWLVEQRYLGRCPVVPNQPFTC